MKVLSHLGVALNALHKRVNKSPVKYDVFYLLLSDVSGLWRATCLKGNTAEVIVNLWNQGYDYV